MMPDDIPRLLQQLEEELHRAETRSNGTRMNELLHPEFQEFGRSGRIYDRAAVLHEFSSGNSPAIRADNFVVSEVGDGVVLLTYRTAHVNPDGTTHRYTLRSSLWVKTPTGWQMRFRQGTPLS